MSMKFAVRLGLGLGISFVLCATLRGDKTMHQRFGYAAYDGLTPVTMKRGEEKRLQDGVTLKFVNLLKEERCPKDVNCVHSGWAIVKTEITHGAEKQEKELIIRGGNDIAAAKPEPKNDKLGSGNTAVVGPFTVILIALDPYPVSTQTPDPAQYEATFVALRSDDLKVREQTIAIARKELNKRLPDGGGYFARGLTPVKDYPHRFIVTFDIPYGPTDQTIRITVDLEKGEVVLFDKVQS